MSAPGLATALANPVATPTLRMLGAPVLTTLGGEVAFTAERPFRRLACPTVRSSWLRRDAPGVDIREALAIGGQLLLTPPAAADAPRSAALALLPAAWRP